MKNLIALIVICLPLLLTAQQTISWKGGTPGTPHSWNQARNWDTNRVPGPNDYVIIAQPNNGHFAHPVIREEVQLASVEIQAGATLEVASSGKLIVDGAYNYSKGIAIYGGRLI
jgi:hypothetical protein